MKISYCRKDCEIKNSNVSNHRSISPIEDGKWRSFIAIIIISSFLFTTIEVAVDGSILAEAETTAANVRTFTYGMTDAVRTGNPNLGTNDADYLLYSFIYDELMVPDQDGNPSPDLATSWWHMDGLTASTQPTPTDFSTLAANKNPTDWPLGSIWEYNLTQNVSWSDGEPFTADDVVFTIDLQISAANYAIFWAFQPYTRAMFAVQKVDEYRVRLFFADRDTQKPSQVAWGNSLSMPIYPKHIIGGMNPIYFASSWSGIPTATTGQFMTTDTLPQDIIGGESVTLIRNPYYNYTDPADGKQKGLGVALKKNCDIDKLVLRFYSDENTLALDLKTGNIDACELTADNYLAMLLNKPEDVKLVSPLDCTGYSYIIHWNDYKKSSGTTNPARADPAVERASALATNKTYIVDQMYKGLGVPGVGILSPVYPQWFWTPGDEPSTFNVTNGKNESSPDYEVLYTYTKPMNEVMSFDINTANAILDAAGYVWNAAHTVRTIGPVAAERLMNMGLISDTAAVFGMQLSFIDLTSEGYPIDVAVSNYIIWQWAEIGIKLTAVMVNAATWSSQAYYYLFEFTHTWWSGEPDPNYLLFVPTSHTLTSWNEFGTADPVYDHYYDMQSSAFNRTEREYWVDAAQEWMYLNGGMMFICYPYALFGLNEIRWTNWGNWTQHPMLAPNYFWGEDPWLFQIKYVGSSGDTDWTPVIVGATTVILVAVISMRILMKKKRKSMLLDEDKEGEGEG